MDSAFQKKIIQQNHVSLGALKEGFSTKVENRFVDYTEIQKVNSTAKNFTTDQNWFFHCNSDEITESALQSYHMVRGATLTPHMVLSSWSDGPQLPQIAKCRIIETSKLPINVLISFIVRHKWTMYRLRLKCLANYIYCLLSVLERRDFK